MHHTDHGLTSTRTDRPYQQLSHQCKAQAYNLLGPNADDAAHDKYLEERGPPDDDIIGGHGFRCRPINNVIEPSLLRLQTQPETCRS